MELCRGDRPEGRRVRLGRRDERDVDEVRVTERVVHGRRDGRHLDGSTAARDRADVVGLVQVAAERHVEDLIALRADVLRGGGTGRDCRRLETERDLDRRRRRDLARVAVRADGEAHHREAARGIVEQPVLVERERAVAGVRRGSGSLRVVEHEEAVAVDGEVGVDPGRLQAALREVGVDRTDPNAVTDGLTVDAAIGLGRRRCEGVVLIEQVLERDVLAFVARRSGIGDVVRDDVDLLLVSRQTGDTDEQRIESHSLTSSRVRETSFDRSRGKPRLLGPLPKVMCESFLFEGIGSI